MSKPERCSGGTIQTMAVGDKVPVLGSHQTGHESCLPPKQTSTCCVSGKPTAELILQWADPYTASFSPDGHSIAVAGLGELAILDASDGRRLMTH